MSAAVGVMVGLPALRVKGIYLGIATLAFGFIVEEVFARWESVTGGNAGMHVKAPAIGGWPLDSGTSFYYLCLVLTVLVHAGHPEPAALAHRARLRRHPRPRSRRRAWASTWRATRRCRSRISAALAGLGGALYAHKIKFISPEQFDIMQSIDLLLMVVIGGLGSVHGAFLGAIFLIAMPQLIAWARTSCPRPSARRPACRPPSTAWC
jgi:branched-chain amino acid transport system permease protein